MGYSFCQNGYLGRLSSRLWFFSDVAVSFVSSLPKIVHLVVLLHCFIISSARMKCFHKRDQDKKKFH